MDPVVRMVERHRGHRLQELPETPDQTQAEGHHGERDPEQHHPLDNVHRHVAPESPQHIVDEDDAPDDQDDEGHIDPDNRSEQLACRGELDPRGEYEIRRDHPAHDLLRCQVVTRLRILERTDGPRPAPLRGGEAGSDQVRNRPDSQIEDREPSRGVGKARSSRKNPCAEISHVKGYSRHPPGDHAPSGEILLPPLVDLHEIQPDPHDDEEVDEYEADIEYVD